MSDAPGGPGWWQASDGKWYPPQQQYQASPQLATTYAPRQMNGLAVAALVCGILWGWGLLSIVALILGIVARRQIRERNQSGEGLAVAGVVLGIIGIVGAVLTTLLLVSVGSELEDELARRTAVVRIEAAPGECWTGHIGDATREGCGSASFEVETFIADVTSATVQKKSGGSGVLTVVIEVDGEEAARSSSSAAFGVVNVTSGA